MFKHFYNFKFFLLAMFTNTNYYLFCQDCRCCCCYDEQQHGEVKKKINNKNIDNEDKKNDFLKIKDVENEIFNGENLLEEEYCLPDTYYQLVSFYPTLDEFYLDKDEKDIWFIKQQNLKDVQARQYKEANEGRLKKTSFTCSSMIFLNKKNKYVIGKSSSQGRNFPYGILWNLEKNSFDKNTFSASDAFSDDEIFEQITKDNNYETYFSSSKQILFGSCEKNVILKIAKDKTIGLAKKLYDILVSPEIKNIQDEKDKIEKITEILNNISNRDDKDLAINENFIYYFLNYKHKYPLYIKNKNNEKEYYSTNINLSLKNNKVFFNIYNEFDIKNNNSRMYFNKLIVDVNSMRDILEGKCNDHDIGKKIIEKKKTKNNLIKFINVAKKIGIKDLLIFKNIEENEGNNIPYYININKKIETIYLEDFINQYASEYLSYEEKFNLGINN